MTRGRGCRLQLLLVLASAATLEYESRGTQDHILLSQIRDSPNLEGQVRVFLYPPGTGLPSLRFIEIMFQNSVPTSQETYYVSATKPNRLMLFRETIAVYCENHTEQSNTLCGQNIRIQFVPHRKHITSPLQ
jgi:hypothetical protein